MTHRTKVALIAAGALAALGGGGIAVAGSVGDDDENEKPITGSALERAKDAALEHTGGGRVTETETGDEESYYEVEVTLDNGEQVDVQLDREFDVVGSEGDSDETEDEAADSED